MTSRFPLEGLEPRAELTIWQPICRFALEAREFLPFRRSICRFALEAREKLPFCRAICHFALEPPGDRNRPILTEIME